MVHRPHFWTKRETGEIPVRTRRCDRGRTPQDATAKDLKPSKVFHKRFRFEKVGRRGQ